MAHNMNVGIRNSRQKCQNDVILFRAEVISKAVPAVPRIWNPEMFMVRDNGKASYPIRVHGWKDPLIIRILKAFCNSVIVSRCRLGALLSLWMERVEYKEETATVALMSLWFFYNVDILILVVSSSSIEKR